MMHCNLKNISSILLPTVLKPGNEITKCDINYFTAAGENYGSILLSVDISIKDPSTGKTETVRAVAKTVPKNDFIKNFFMSSLTFKKELGFYSTIVPTLRAFQADEGIENLMNLTADFYGGRLTLDDHHLRNESDEDAVILMRNLKADGYKILDRNIGLDFETACLIIQNLALLHAVPVAIKIRKSDIFKEKIEPYLEYADVFVQSVTEEMRKEQIEDILNIAKENPKCVPYLTALKKKCEKCYSISGETNTDRPFATLTHNDLWINNIMIKFGENGRPIHSKIVDFQFTALGSPGKDIIFFIFDNVQNQIIQTKFEELIQLYHKTFVSTLQQLKVDTSDFTFDKLEEELDYAASNTVVIWQCFAMLRPIFAVKESGTEVENLRTENLFQFKEASTVHKKKLYCLVEEFAKRRWI